MRITARIALLLLVFLSLVQAQNLEKIIPGVSHFEIFDRFQFLKKSINGDEFSVEGHIDDIPVTITRSGRRGFTLSGRGIQIGQIIPATLKLRFLNQFVFHRLVYTGDGTVVVNGTVSSKTISFGYNLSAPSKINMTGSALSLKDFITIPDGVGFFDNFFLGMVKIRGKRIIVKGRVSDTKIAFEASSKKDFSIRGEGIKLTDFIPASKGIHFLERLKIKDIVCLDAQIKVMGEISGKHAQVDFNPTDLRKIKIEKTSLKLHDVLPFVSKFHHFKQFKLGGIEVDGDSISVVGSINRKRIYFQGSFKGEKEFAIQGEGLKLRDFIPLTSRIPFLKSFVLSYLSHSEKKVTLKGQVNGNPVEIDYNPSKLSELTLDGSGLRPQNLIPSIKKLNHLKKFLVDKVAVSGTKIFVHGSAWGKDVTFFLSTTHMKEFSLKGSGLKIRDFVPEASKLTFLDRFELASLDYSKNQISISGSILGKGVTVVFDLKVPSRLSLKGVGLSFKDIVPKASGFKFLSKLKLSSVKVTSKKIVINGKIAGKSIHIESSRMNPSSFDIKGEGLHLTDLIPAARKINYLDRFALEEIKIIKSKIMIRGEIAKKKVTIESDLHKEKEFIFRGTEMVLKDFVPQANKLHFLNKLKLMTLSYHQGKINLDGELGKKSLHINYDINDWRKISLKGPGIDLSSIISEVKSFKLFSKFKLGVVDIFDKNIHISGTILGKEAVFSFLRNGTLNFKVKCTALTIHDFISLPKETSFIDSVKIEEFSYLNKEISIVGNYSGKSINVQYDLRKLKDFSFAGAGVKISDIIPSVKSLNVFEKFTLSSVSVTAKKFSISGKINNKVTSIVKERTGAKTIYIVMSGAKVSDIFSGSKSIPVLKGLAVEEIAIAKNVIAVQVELNGEKVDVVSHFGKEKKHNFLAIYFKRLAASTFIPAAKGHVVNSIQLDDALFIIASPESAGERITTTDLPGTLAKKISHLDEITLKSGVNFSSMLDISSAPTLRHTLNHLGIKGNKLPLRGTLSRNSFKVLGGKIRKEANRLAAKDKASLLKGLSLKVNLPTPNMESFEKLVKVTAPITMSLNGNSTLWSQLPESLRSHRPKGDLDLAISFGISLNGVGIKEKLLALIDVNKGKKTEIDLIAISKSKWVKPFGIPDLTLEKGGFLIRVGGTKEIDFFATTDIGSKKNIAVSADMLQKENKITLKFFELDGTFKLSDFAFGKKIPHSNKFELDEVKVSTDGLELKTKLSGKKVSGFLFKHKDDYAFAIEQNDFNLTEILPAAKKIKPLRDFKLKKAALILTKSGLHGKKEDMGVIAKDLFDDIFGNSNGTINLPEGIALFAGFDAKSLGLLGKGLSKIGVHDDALIMGEINGVFEGSPGIRLGLLMDQAGKAHGLPHKVMSYKHGVKPSFFIQWSGDELDAGVQIGMDVKAGKDHLELATTVELEFTPEGVGIKLLGEMDGIWHKPFGIHGINLANLKMDVSIDEMGEAQIGFAGEEQFGNCKNIKSSECVDIKLATSVKIALEEGLPEGIAFAGEVSELGIAAIVDIAETLLQIKGGLGKLPIPFFSIKKARLVFATPGASDPQIGLVGEGFAFGGEFFFMNKELGAVRGVGSPTSGISFHGDIADIDLDILEFEKNTVDIAIGFKPKFIINSNIKLLGESQKILLDIAPPHFEFQLTEDLGHFGFADLRVRLDGFDLKSGKFDKDADISVIGEFKSNLVPWLKNEITVGVKELKKSADAKLDANIKELDAQQKKVDDINKKIQSIRAQDDKAKRRSEAKLESAKKRVSSLKSSYNKYKHKEKHCGSRWTHWACSGYWEVKAASTWVVYKVAMGVLDAAEAGVSAAFDLDPRIAALIGERDIEHAALSIAKAVVEAAKKAEDFILNEIEKIMTEALKDLPFELDKAIVIGDLKDMIKKGDPLVMDLSFKLFGHPMREYMAIKLNNLTYDAISFALLPAIALDYMTESALKKIDPSVARWVHSHIGAKLAQAEAKVRTEVQAEEKKYKDVLASFENNSAKFRDAFQKQAQAHVEIASNFQVSDLMGKSLTYPSTYLAVGHSKLCLGVSKNGVDVIQEDCKDSESEKWSTHSLKDGYVQLRSKGLCLKARNKDTRQGQPLMLAVCTNKDYHEQWKIISTDGFFDKIVNRYSQKCLHFNNESANPDASYAVWTSCMGSDSQSFRAIMDAEKPTWHGINSKLAGKDGFCLSVRDESKDKITAKKKTIPLYSKDCSKTNDRYNFMEDVNGDITLVHGEHGGCVYSAGTTVALRACDRGKDMFWRNYAEGGSSFTFHNVYTNKCLSLPKSKGLEQAKLVSCGTLGHSGLTGHLDFIK